MKPRTIRRVNGAGRTSAATDTPAVKILRLLSGALLEVVKHGPRALRAAAEEERAAIQKRLEAAHGPKLDTSTEDAKL